MDQSHGSEPLEVTVERILPFGVFVRLQDGTQGYIRKRELDLDADIKPAEIVQVGQKIQAIVIKSEEGDNKLELSRRVALKDPWAEFSKHVHSGDVVRGTVRALHPNGVFVRVQAGINGFVPLSDIASWEVLKPEDVLWIGDNVEAMITNIDADGKRLLLSIKTCMLQRDSNKSLPRAGSQSVLPATFPSPTTPVPPISLAIRDRVGTILIVDDHDGVRTSLAGWLNRRGFITLQAHTAQKAILLTRAHDCRVLIVDLNLVDQDGLDLVRHLRQNSHNAHICIMSSLDELIERSEEIEAVQVAQVFSKPLDAEEIEAFLASVARGEPRRDRRAAPRRSAMPGETEVSQKDQAPIEGGLQFALEQATRLLQAETGVIFQLDDTTQGVSILSKFGDRPIRFEAVYGLTASPVQDVIREGVFVFANHATEQARAKFAKLLELLPFESSIGVPIYVEGEIRHAAFFFHQTPDAFLRYRLREAQTAALLFASILTRERLQGQLQSLNPMFLSGELARGFGHDVFNKITALDLEARFLIGQDNRAGIQTTAQHLLELILDLKVTVQAFQQLLQPKGIHEIFDVNQVVRSAIDLLSPIARKDRAKIEVNLGDNLPCIQGNYILLQQVFLNIMLNSVQQMSLKAEKHKWAGKRVLQITTSLNNKMHRIRVRFTDHGPGIHQADLQKVFFPGFSTRGGSGLGLYIARSFIESLDGVLKVQETLVPLGTTFVVEVPLMRGDPAK